MIRRNKRYKYDPLKVSKSKEWLAMDEEKKIALIEAYHLKERIELPNVKVHAIFHMTVENQAAMGDKSPTKAAIKRLMIQGADRHEAVHAVASVLSKYFYEGVKTKIHKDGAALNAAYEEEVRNLTLQKWYGEFG